MLELGLTPNDPRVAEFTDVHWFIYYRAIMKREHERFNMLKELIVGLLGLKIPATDSVLPLSYFIAPEFFRSLMEEERVIYESDVVDMDDSERMQVLDELDKQLEEKGI